MGTHPIFESDFDCLTEMGDYNVVIDILGIETTLRFQGSSTFTDLLQRIEGILNGTGGTLSRDQIRISIEDTNRVTQLDNAVLLDIVNNGNVEQNLQKRGMRDGWRVVVMPNPTGRIQNLEEETFIAQLHNPRFFLTLRQRLLRTRWHLCHAREMMMNRRHSEWGRYEVEHENSIFTNPELVHPDFFGTDIVLGDRHLIRAFIEERITFIWNQYFYANDDELIQDILLNEEPMETVEYNTLGQIPPEGLRFLHYNHVSTDSEPAENILALHHNLRS